jgi:uncharacterized tellurite resistance protein B-like protein
VRIGYDARMSDPRAEALLEMMFLAVHADGEFNDAERKALAKAIHDRGGPSGAAFEQSMDRIAKGVASQGRAARIKALAATFPDAKAKEDALTAVIEMVAADGIVRTSERELILEVADGLGIAGDRAADLVQAGTRDMR